MGIQISKGWWTEEAQAAPAPIRRVNLYEQQRVMRMDDLPELMNARDVAKKLRIHHITAAKWLKTQRIRSTKIDGRRVTTPEWIADYLRTKGNNLLDV